MYVLDSAVGEFARVLESLNERFAHVATAARS
jgi:hypothetical protein